MIPEATLKRACRPAVYERGQLIARREGHIWKRSLRYRGPLTVLTANVDSSSGYSDYYRTSITLDETAGEVVDYTCTCPAKHRFAGPCKHCMALAFDYNRHPDHYRGFDGLQHVSTTPALSAYLERSRSQAQAQANLARPVSDDDAGGTVTLAPTLAILPGQSPTLRLRVGGPRGSYVLKSISGFVQAVVSGAWYEYGQKLAFTHDRAAFAPESRPLVDFLVRAVQNRQSYQEGVYGASSRSGYAPASALVPATGASYSGYGYAGYGSGRLGSSSTMGRELRLSDPECDELLDILMGRSLQLEVSGASGALTRQVAEGDPEVQLDVEAAGQNGYELRRTEGVVFFATTAQLYAVDQTTLWRCTDRLRPLSGFLAGAWATGATQYLAKRDAPAFAANLLPALERGLTVRAPEDLEALRPVPLKLCFYLDRTGQGVSLDLVASYGRKSYHVLAREVGDQVDPGRDLAGETAARQLVGRYFPQARATRGSAVVRIPLSQHEAVARLVFEGVPEFSRLGEVLATDAFGRLASKTRPRVHVGVRMHANLIDLSISAGDLPQDELAALLASYREKRRYHRLRDGSFIDLEGLDLSQADAVVGELGLGARELAAGHVEVPAYKAFLLDSIMSDDEKDESFDRYVEGFRAIDPTGFAVPEGLACDLRSYQRAGFQWLSALVGMDMGGILADEMGLGKSVQLIALILAQRGSGPSLIVCPASLVYNWQAEFQKFAPQLDVVAVAGTAPQRSALRRQDHEVYITSYDLLRRDVRSWAQKDLWLEALDEAQYIKNHETLAARATKALSARHRLALTGTPIENRLSELWSIFDFLMPGLLGSYERFSDRYEQPIVAGDEEVAARLRAAVGPFILRRLKKDVLQDLPDKSEQVVSVQMGHDQRKLYQGHVQALRQSLRGQDDAAFTQGKLQVLAELTRLRQICCDPRLLFEDYQGGSCKLDAIMELVSSAMDSQQKVLVFSQFTSYLALIAKELDQRGVAYYTITGATPKRRRLDLVDAFNGDDTPVFLVSLKAGGTGLNLVGASVVVHADPWWNAAAQNQATDRAHRIGQTRDVSVYKVIARDTIEERIVALQELKSDLANQVVGQGTGLSLASLRKEDLLELLG